MIERSYEVLGIDKSASIEDVKDLWRKLALIYHPDKNPNNSKATEKFQELSEAYQIVIEFLQNPSNTKTTVDIVPDIEVEDLGDLLTKNVAWYGGRINAEEISQVIHENRNLNLDVYYGEQWQHQVDWVKKHYNIVRFLEKYKFHLLVTKSSFWSGTTGFAIVHSTESPCLHQGSSNFLVMFDEKSLEKDIPTLFCLGIDSKFETHTFEEYSENPFRLSYYTQYQDGRYSKSSLVEYNLDSDVETLLKKILDKWSSNALF